MTFRRFAAASFFVNAEIVACASAIFRCSSAACSALWAARLELSVASICADSADFRDLVASVACQIAIMAEITAMTVEVISKAVILLFYRASPTVLEALLSAE